jgi:hypothetical protein
VCAGGAALLLVLREHAGGSHTSGSENPEFVHHLVRILAVTNPEFVRHLVNLELLLLLSLAEYLIFFDATNSALARFLGKSRYGYP